MFAVLFIVVVGLIFEFINGFHDTANAIATSVATTRSHAFDQLPPWLEFLRAPEFKVYPWIKIICAVTIGAGTAVGGWRIIQTVGRKLVRLQPIHGFAAQSSAAAIIHLASH